MGVFLEEICKTMVVEQLALLDDWSIWKAFLPVDLEIYSKGSKRAKKELI